LLVFLLQNQIILWWVVIIAKILLFYTKWVTFIHKCFLKFSHIIFPCLTRLSILRKERRHKQFFRIIVSKSTLCTKPTHTMWDLDHLKKSQTRRSPKALTLRAWSLELFFYSILQTSTGKWMSIHLSLDVWRTVSKNYLRGQAQRVTTLGLLRVWNFLRPLES
jgi:hypothetical protein